MHDTTMMTDSDVMTEISTYHLEGQVYYRHEGGTVYTVSLAHIAQAEAKDAPFVFSFAQAVPDDADAYEPREGSRAAGRLDNWVEACDLHAAPLTDEDYAAFLAVTQFAA